MEYQSSTGFLNSLDRRKLPQNDRSMLILYAIQLFLCGAEVSASFVSSWRYINETLEPTNSRLVYSVLISSFYLPVVFLGSLTRQWCTKTKHIGRIVLLTNVAVVIGSFMYSIPTSTLCVIFGKIFQGFTLISQAAITSNPIHTGTRKKNVLILNLSYHASWMLTPSVFLFLGDGEFRIGMIKITYGNFAGVYILFLSSLCLILTMVILASCIKEKKSFALQKYRKFYTNTTLKKYQSFQDENERIDKIACKLPLQFKSQPNWVEVMTKLVNKNDQKLGVILFNISTNIPQTTTLYLLPLLYIDLLNLKHYFVNISFASLSVLPLIFMLLMSWKKTVPIYGIYVFIWITLILLLLASVLLLLLNFRQHEEYLKIFSLVVLSAVLGMLRVTNSAFNPDTIPEEQEKTSTAAPLSSKNIDHGWNITNIHYLMLNVSNVTSGVLAGCVYNHMHWFYSTVILLILAAMTFMYKNKHSKNKGQDRWYEFWISSYSPGSIFHIDSTRADVTTKF